MSQEQDGHQHTSLVARSMAKAACLSTSRVATFWPPAFENPFDLQTCSDGGWMWWYGGRMGTNGATGRAGEPYLQKASADPSRIM